MLNKYIYTSKMYSPIETSTYNTAKRLHLNALHVNYTNMDTREKWRLVMAQFGSLVPAASRATVSSFTAEREPVVDNPNAINLEDCLNYFEQFYFLHTTTDPLYQLSETEKTNLQKIVLSGMGNACEPGKQERFDMVLMLYRQDTHWIKNELAKYRYNLLQILQERYNTAYAVGGGYSSHTFKLMKKLAHTKGFSVSCESEVNDAFLIDRQITSITQYFEQHYPQLINDFENSALDNLAQNLMLELSDFLHRKNINGQQWDSQGVVIPNEHHRELNDLFESKSFSEIMIYLRDDADNIDDWVLQLKKKGDVLQGLRALISETLSKDGYIIDVAKLHDVSLSDLHTKEGIEIERLVKISRTLDNVIAGSTSGDDRTYLKKHHTLLLQCPVIIRRHISQTPEIYSMLPEVLKTNSRFITAAVVEYETLLLNAIQHDDHQRIESLINGLLGLIAPEMDYLANISQDLLNNRIIAQKLIQHDGLFLKQLTTFKDDDELVQAAITQNGLALYYASARFIKNVTYIDRAQVILNQSFGLRLDSPNPSIQGMYHYRRLYNKLPDSCKPLFPSDMQHAVSFDMHSKNMKKVHAIHILSTQPQIRASQVASFLQILTPPLLLNIMNERRTHGLLPLPFCFDESLLRTFNQSLNAQHIDLKDGYVQAKIRATALIDANTDTVDSDLAHICLATTNNWYAAFVQFQQQQTPQFKNLNHFLQTLQATLSAIVDLLTSVMCYALFGLIALTLFMMMQLCIISMIVVLISAIAVFAIPFIVIANEFNPILSMIIAIAAYFIALGVSILVLDAFVDWMEPYTHALFNMLDNALLPDANKFFNALTQSIILSSKLTTQIYNTLFVSDETPGNTLIERCEYSIARLQFKLDDEDAHQKGLLLEQIWDNIQQDVGAGEHDLHAHLNKKYTTTHQGKTHELSFFDVASTKRQHSDRFSIDEPKSTWRFFSDMGSTTTCNLLTSAQDQNAAFVP